MKRNILFISLLLISLILLTLVLYSCSPTPDTTDLGEWPVKSPQSQGVSKTKLQELKSAIKNQPFIDSFLLVRNGYLILEEYYNGYDKNTTHDLCSITKSIIGCLVGIAIDQGLIESLDQKAIDFFPEYTAPDYVDPDYPDSFVFNPEVHNITIRHLLNMTSGLPDPGAGDILPGEDPIYGIFRLRLNNKPGESFLYTGSSPHILSAIISKASGMNAQAYAQAMLCEPLGIDIPSWTADKFGNSYGGALAEMTPRDMAWLGYLYLHGGTCDGIKIVSREWTDQVLRFATDNMIDWQWEGYGYKNLWWVETISGEQAFTAIGAGGQLILSIPSLDVVIVTTCNIPIKGVGLNAQAITIYKLIEEYVIPAIEQ